MIKCFFLSLFSVASGFCDFEYTDDGVYQWNETAVGVTSSHDCFFGGGEATRLCRSRGQWDSVNYSQCISECTPCIFSWELYTLICVLAIQL